MAIFDLFKKRPKRDDEPDAIDQALAALTGGDAVAAFALLRPAIAYPAPLQDTAVFARAFAAFARIAQAISGEPFAALVTQASAQPNDAQALHDAAHEAYEQQLFDVAATLLVRANRLAPGSRQIVTEAAGALEVLLRYGEAALLVDASGLVESDSLCAYLSGFCWLMGGDRSKARRSLVRLAEVSEAKIVDMRTRLTGMLARADALAHAGLLSETSLSAWHMALNGTLLLHESPHGNPEPMHGRYAFVSDSQQLMHDGIERLRAVLGDAVPLRVVHAPDRASRIQTEALRRGLIIEKGGRQGCVLRFLPPLVIRDDEIDFAADAVAAAIHATA